MGYLTLRERYFLGKVLKKSSCKQEEKKIILAILNKLREPSFSLSHEECAYLTCRLLACFEAACDCRNEYQIGKLQCLIEKVSEFHSEYQEENPLQSS